MNVNRPDREDDSTVLIDRLRLAVESSPTPIIIVDASCRIVLVNEQTEQWFGYDRDELLGREIEILIPQRFQSRHRADRDRYLAAPTVRPMGTDRPLTGRRRDGTEFPVDVSLHPITAAEGTLVIAHLANAEARRAADKEAQRRHAVERLALIGQLAASVAHEIRNPLGVIRNAAYYLHSMQALPSEEAQQAVREIQQEVTRADKIVGDLLDFARNAPHQSEVYELGARAEALIARHPPEERILEYDGPDRPLLVRADPGQVDQILGNLVRNAVQATDAADNICLRIRRAENLAVVDVIDAGPGIAAEDRDRVFDPLFTTRAKGIGLGLTVSRRYAQRNGGELELVDRPGPGATFRLTVPLADETDGSPDAGSAP